MSTQELTGFKKREQLRSMIDSMKLEDLMEKDFEYVGPEEQLSDVVKKMGQLDVHEIPVSQDGKRLMGVVSYSTLLKRRNLSSAAKAGSISVMPQEITPSTPLTEVAEAFLSSGYRQIPVVKGQVIQGVITRANMIRIVRGIKELRDIKVEEIMTKDVQTVSLNDPVEKALMSMKNLTIRTLPVVDTSNHLTGIIGIKQVANHNWRERKRETVGELTGERGPVEVKVSSIALDSVFTIGPEADLGKAADIMLDRNISALPVVDKEELVGIITKYDMIELITSLRERDVVYMQITGLEQDDRFAMDEMEKVITTTMQKVAKITRPMLFTLHITKYNAQGNNYKYSLNGRLITENKIWVASSTDWDLMKATQVLMDVFERRIIEHKEEKLDQRKHSRDIGHH